MNYTLRKTVEFFTCILYREAFERISAVSKEVFVTGARDVYSQALEDLGIGTDRTLSEKEILEMAVLPDMEQTFEEHLQTMASTQAQEMSEYIFSITVTDDEISEEVIRAKLKTQGNRIISVTEAEPEKKETPPEKPSEPRKPASEPPEEDKQEDVQEEEKPSEKAPENPQDEFEFDKQSGTLVDTARVVDNTAYISAVSADDPVKFLCMFIAEIDDVTTKMCRSMNGRLFWVNDWNEFTRWSDMNKDYVHVKIFGLQLGVNLPPIRDHFHWCRSTVQYEKYGSQKYPDAPQKERRTSVDDIDEEAKLNDKPAAMIYAGLRNCKDVTEEWKNNRKEKQPVKENRDTVMGNDGIRRSRGEEGVDMTFEPKEEDRKAAEWWANNKGGDVRLNPRLNKPEGIKTADLEIDGEQVEVKTLNGKGNWALFNATKKIKQAPTYLIDIGPSDLSHEEAVKQIDLLFGNGQRSWIKKIILRDGDELVGVFERQ